MTTHASLTESSVSYHPVTHDGKGREGKGREGKGREKEWMGGLVETSHHAVAYVGAAASASAAPTVPGGRVDMMPSTIEGIDFDAEVPCGHSAHHACHPDEPAAYIVRCWSPCGCEPTVTYPLCGYGWVWLGEGEIRCPSCDWTCWRDEVLRIVEVLR